MLITGCSSDGQNVRFGSVRSRVQVSPSRQGTLALAGGWPERPDETSGRSRVQVSPLRLKMKKILLLVFVVSIFFLVFSLKEKPNFLSYKLNNKTYKLLTAKNSYEWEKGLMFYKSKKELKGADGMIFIFPKKEIRSFWNENTYLDLDVYWIDGDKIIGKSYLPSILKSKEVVIVESSGKADKVIEIIK